MATTKITNELINDSAVNAAKLDVTGNGTPGQALLSDGDGTFTWGDAGGGVEGTNSVYVVPSGTAEQNGASLLTGLTAAIDKIGIETGPGAYMPVYYYDVAPNAYSTDTFDAITFSTGPQYQAIFDGTPVLITIISTYGEYFVEFEMINLDGTPYGNIIGSPDFPAPPSIQYTPSTLIIAPGDYSIASDFILNNLVNVTSLTGQADVNISTSNVKIQSGANSSFNPISIVGLNLTTSLFIQSNLNYLTFKNCKAFGSNSFSIEPDGIGSIAGTFEDCTGGELSFGGGLNVYATGLFIRCKSFGNNSFGGNGSTSGYFEYCGGSIVASYGSVTTQGNSFGKSGLNVNGYFYYCSAGNQSFASGNTGATNAEFYYCKAGSQSFAYRNSNNDGKFYNCTSTGNQCFGSNPLSGDLAANARYYNCSAGTIAESAVGSASRFYGCHAITNWSSYSAGNNGLAYNCSFGSFGGQGSVSGTGKYRNCLNGSLVIINEG